MNIKQMIEKKRGLIGTKINKIQDLATSLADALQDEDLKNLVAETAASSLSESVRILNTIIEGRKLESNVIS